MDKTKGVMTALKGRASFGEKKGVNLLGIVQKLTNKRKAEKETAAEDKAEKGKEE